MSSLRRAVLGAVGFTAGVTALHAWLNLDLLRPRTGAREKAPLRIGFLPVTCHLTCPVNHWIQENLSGEGGFEPVKFNAWPELKESFLSGTTQASFMLAPMAMVLAQQGVPLKVVYLGHRDGTALVVHKDSDIWSIGDLRGRRVAIPGRYANQKLIICKALKDAGVPADEVQLIEMPPPDMPAALYARAVDLVCSGEPFMGQTELDGYGRVLHQAKELWPGFISCVLVAHQRLIDEEPKRLQAIVDGIARSGLWLDQDMSHRLAAAKVIAGPAYYNQDPRLLGFVLSKPPDRVTYSQLRLARKDFQEIHDLALEVGILDGPIAFERYADERFSERTHEAVPWEWTPR